MSLVAALEIGGTHASAVLVEPDAWAIRPEPRGEVALRGDDPADVLLDALAVCVRALGTSTAARLAVAVPGPFDYVHGVGRFAEVGKFDALNGVDVRAALAARLPYPPERITFLNDATAFALGEWRAGADARLVAVTLGTGIGSAFVADGVAVTTGPDVPPEGYAYRLTIDDRPLEDVVSRRAILGAFRASGGDPALDVREIADQAGRGDDRARAAFTGPLTRLGAALAPWLVRFRADAVVVGGAMSASWSLVGPALRAGIGPVPVPVRVRRAADARSATAIGAAWDAGGDAATARRGGGR